jgi:hypothetical protein
MHLHLRRRAGERCGRCARLTNRRQRGRTPFVPRNRIRAQLLLRRASTGRHACRRLPLPRHGAAPCRDTRALARELLAMGDEDFRIAFKNSPMKRAKLRGLKRNAAEALGNVGTIEDAPILLQALDDPEPLVREHAAWALGRVSPGR